MFKTNVRKIEIDITYDCNMRCLNCDRFLGMSPSNIQMELEQIKRFVKESKEKKITWKEVKVLGGEPTIHPSFVQIIKELQTLDRDRLVIYSNGRNPAAFEDLPKGFEISGGPTKKSNTVTYFDRVNMAPIDEDPDQDFPRGCQITEDCGIGFNAFGFYQCAVAGAIDRMVGLDIGLKEIPAEGQDLSWMMDQLCRYCGHFKEEGYALSNAYNRNDTRKQHTSPTWARIFEEHEKNPPKLTRY